MATPFRRSNATSCCILFPHPPNFDTLENGQGSMNVPGSSASWGTRALVVSMWAKRGLFPKPTFQQPPPRCCDDYDLTCFPVISKQRHASPCHISSRFCFMDAHKPGLVDRPHVAETTMAGGSPSGQRRNCFWQPYIYLDLPKAWKFPSVPQISVS